ncbi:hypothetical protein OOT46_29360 [Aquabacterium sp. A7-Y]|uniref:hypothetical protein n=1 Tax=Aquabacterium sp. A7-Y TaxID=1349605 RepID=UPI00223E872E|nr:hypothetical protein [Aquabacterium sp. A7-Y]MCW7541910.1 hypothetical protein [Aquabacterium sp. A7-Y]
MSTAPPPPSAGEVATWIRRYLRKHPRAADTARGIQRWWLAPSIGEVPLSTVEQALATLEREGAVYKLDPLKTQPAYGRGQRFGRHR